MSIYITYRLYMKDDIHTQHGISLMQMFRGFPSYSFKDFTSNSVDDVSTLTIGFGVFEGDIDGLYENVEYNYNYEFLHII